LLLALPAADPVLAARAGAFGAALAALAGHGQSLAAALGGGVMERASATVHPVTYGWLMTLAALAALAGAFAAPRAAERRWAGALAALYGTALALSQTRSAQIAFILGMISAALGRPRWRKAALAAGAGCALLFAGVVTLAPAAGREAGLASAFGHRAALWSVAWDAFRSDPLTGLGPGGYRAFYTEHGPVLDNQAVWSNAHNLYAHQLAERGLPGLAAALAVLGLAFAGAWRLRARPEGAVALGACAAFAAFNCFETALQTEQAATAFLAVWAWARTRPGAEMVS